MSAQPRAVAPTRPYPRLRTPALPALPGDLGSRTLIGLATLAGLLILGLLATVLYISLRTAPNQRAITLANYGGLIHDVEAFHALANTAVFSAVTLGVALTLGLPAAWLSERTDLPARGLLYGLLSAGLLIPGFFFGMAWDFLFDANAGLVNRWLHLRLDVASLPGMGLVEGLALAPVVFILTAASLRAIDPSLEESAEMSGAGRWTVLRRVTFPLVRPGIAGAAVFVLTVSVAAFDVPLMIGQSHRILTFSTYLFEKTSPAQGFGQIPYGAAAAVSSVVAVIALALSLCYVRVLAQARRYQVVGGRGYQPRLLRLGWRAITAWVAIGLYFLFGIAGTLAVTLWTAFQPFAGRLPSLAAARQLTFANFEALPWEAIWVGAIHTLVLVILAPSLALLLSIAFSWVVLRTRSRLRLAYDFVAFLPQGVPATILAFAAFVAAIYFLPASLTGQTFYRSLGLLVIVQALVLLAFATRLTNAALIQIKPELEEAGQMSGAPSLIVLLRLTLPLIRPALASGWIWLAFLAFRELTLPAMLASRDNQTLTVLVYQQWVSNQARAAALTVVMLAVVLPLVPFLWRASRSQFNS